MTDTQLATTNKSPIIVLRERLESRRADLKNALPDDISPDRFIRSVIVSAQINPDILACSWQSVWLACMRACRDGLIPDGVEAAIVPFKATASYIPMYQGLLRNFRRSGRFKWVTAGLARQGELFEHWIDETGEHFKHIPGDAFSAPILRIYALATTKDGGIFITVLPIEEADKMRNMSRATREDSPWRQWPEEMYKKTALRRLSKMLPTARDGTSLADLDDDEPLDWATAAPAGPPAGIARESGAAAALAQFASPPAAGSSPLPPAGASEAGADTAFPAATADPPQNEQQSQQQPAPADAHQKNDADEAVTMAWQRGKDAKAAGLARRAVPGEYRAADATRLAAAWVRGWDGQPL